MTTPFYKVATGHAHAVGAQTDINPQPRTDGLQYTRRQYAASGIVLDELPFIELKWSVFESVTEYQSILSQFGLTSASYALVSVYVQDENFNWITRDATALKPLINQDGSRNNFLLRDFTILLRDLQAQS
jgi:hypothetical protein